MEAHHRSTDRGGSKGPRYAYERRPKLVDPLLNWWYGRNRAIERAPIVLLTGAGASVAAGIPGLTLLPTISLAGGLELDVSELTPLPGTTGPGDILDLESLLIASDILASLPRDVVHRGIQLPNGVDTPEEQLKLHREVLVAMLGMLLPGFAGGGSLSTSFLHAIIDRLIAADRRHGGAVLNGLSESLTGRVFDACLAIDRNALADLYAPLIKELARLAERRGGPAVIPVFTTNYDEAFAFLGDELRAELSEAVGRAVEVFDATRPWPGYPGWRQLSLSGYRRFRAPADGRIVLVVFYLHGSIRWFLSTEVKGRFELQIGDATIARSPAAPRYRALLFPDGQKILWSKAQAGLSNLFAPGRKDPFRPGSIYYAMRLGYEFLARCLRRSGALVAIGYSFRDSDCRDLLVDAWARETGRHLVLLDPSPAPVAARFPPGSPITPVPHRFAAEAVPTLGSVLEQVLG